MSTDKISDPITEVFHRIVPGGSHGFSAKHLIKYIEDTVAKAQHSMAKSNGRSLMSLGKNVRSAIQTQAVSLYLFTLLDQNGDGIVDSNDLLVCKKKFLFWMAPVKSYNSIASIEEYFHCGKNRFRHISLLCGEYHQISIHSLESLFYEKLPIYVPSRKNISALAAPILLHLLSKQSHLPLQERVITQQDWLTNIGALYYSIFHNQDYAVQDSYSRVSK